MFLMRTKRSFLVFLVVVYVIFIYQRIPVTGNVEYINLLVFSLLVDSRERNVADEKARSSHMGGVSRDYIRDRRKGLVVQVLRATHRERDDITS